MLSHSFPLLSKFTIAMFWVWGIVWFSASREICKKHLTLECSVFSYFSRTIENPFPHVLGTILLMWRLMKKVLTSDPISTQTFVWNSSLRKSTYFAPEYDPIPNTQYDPILDPFVKEVWKYIQYRRVGSVFYGSGSIEILLWKWQLEFI